MKAIAIIILAVFCTLSGLQAQEDIELPGKRFKTWIIPTYREPVRVGLLYEIKDTSVVVSNSLHKADYLIGKFGLAEMGVERIKMIKVRNENATQIGMLIGGLIGATGGLTLGIWQFSRGGSEADEKAQTGGLVFIPVFFTAAGVGMGLAASSFKINIPLKGKQEEFDRQRSRLEKYSLEFNAKGKPPESRMFKRSPYSIKDIDGNVYEIVIVGDRMWLAENLKVTRYSNGDSIPEVTGNEEWSNLATGAYCNPINDPGKATRYGRLYNRYVISESRNPCPAGWHVATFSDWESLIDTLGGPGEAGALMRDKEIPHWSKTNRGKNPYTEFALLAGSRNRNGEFIPPNRNASFWWSKTESQEIVVGILLGEKGSSVGYVSQDAGENAGMSVRCVMSSQ